jgi:DNA-binding transcriptional LysR family regulator
MSVELDVKVLRAIDTLSTAGSVTKAAEILQVTPGAVTYLINKARKATGSALFFRTKEGMKPNTLATELSQRYQNMIEAFPPDDTGAANHQRSFIISTYTLIEFLLALAWGPTSEDEAELRYVTSDQDKSRRLAALRNKEVDIDLGSRLQIDSSIIQVKLFTAEVGMIARKDHPTIGERFTIEDWHENRHALWSRGMYFFSDDIEQTQDFHNLFEQQNPACVSSSSLNAVMLCAYSDCVTRMPKNLGSKLESILPVKQHSLPDNLHLTYECYLHYHHSFINDPHFQQVIRKIKSLL